MDQDLEREHRERDRERKTERGIGIGIMLARVVDVAAEDITTPARDMVRRREGGSQGYGRSTDKWRR